MVGIYDLQWLQTLKSRERVCPDVGSGDEQALAFVGDRDGLAFQGAIARAKISRRNWVIGTSMSVAYTQSVRPRAYIPSPRIESVAKKRSREAAR